MKKLKCGCYEVSVQNTGKHSPECLGNVTLGQYLVLQKQRWVSELAGGRKLRVGRLEVTFYRLGVKIEMPTAKHP